MKKDAIQTSWIRRISELPIIVLVVYICTVLSLIVMIILFFASQTERELSFVVNPIRTQVVTMGQASGLDILHNGKHLGDIDITAVQVAIWNSGDESIREENVLKEVIIYTEPSVQILEASVVKYNRDFDITGLTIIDTPDSLNIGKLPVEWYILEKNDGAIIQLIYIGSTDINIMVDGLIEGSGQIRRVDYGVDFKTPAEQVQSEQIYKWAMIPLMVLFLVMLIGISKDAFNSWRDNNRKMAFIMPSIMTVLFLGAIYFIVYT